MELICRNGTVYLELQALVVETWDSTIHRIDHYPLEKSCWGTNIALYTNWIEIYPADSDIYQSAKKVSVLQLDINGQAVASIVFLASPKKILTSRIDYSASVI